MSRIPGEAPQAWLPWLLAPVLGVLAFGLGRCAPALEPGPIANEDRGEEADEAAEPEVWSCSMHPQVQRDQPGPCPLCGMDLIPLSAMPDASSERVSLSERAAVLAQIQTVEVERISAPGVDLRLLGRVEVDESRVRNVSAWVGGRVDKLLVRETGKVVRKGQTIALLYSPEVYTAHQDLLTAAKQVEKLRNASELARGSAEATLDSARERLSLLGLSDRSIDRMSTDLKPRKSMAITATEGGTVMERLVTQGQYVEAGAVLYRIVDLSKVWVQLDAYESDLPALMEGQTVELSVEALPGERFGGEIAFIDPIVDTRRRVTRIRVEADNTDGKLRPGMFVEAVVQGDEGEGDNGDGDNGDASEARQKPLVVPVTAPLFTGKRSLVYVEVEVEGEDDTRPSYEPRVVELGPRMGERYPVVAGLAEGERVVVHGAFAIDADLQIRGGASMMSRPNQDLDAGVRIEADAELRAQLSAVLEAYLDIQVALADDAWEPSQRAAIELLVALGEVEAPEGPAADVWDQLGPALVHHGNEAAKSEAIEGVRGAFLHLSASTRALLGVFGNPLPQPLRLAYCPMANSNEGAEWIQATDQVDNSYFGESMLSCGEFRAVIEPGQYLLSERERGLGGHQH